MQPKRRKTLFSDTELFLRACIGSPYGHLVKLVSGPELEIGILQRKPFGLLGIKEISRDHGINCEAT